MRISLVTPNNDVRDGALFVALARACPGLQIIAPAAQTSAWPDDVDVKWIRTHGSNWTRQWMTGLETAIQAHDPDLIHIQNEPWAITTQRLLRTKRPVVIHGAESVLNAAPYSYRLRRVGMRAALGRAAGYISWGQTGLRAAEAAGLLPATPRAVIPASPPDPHVFRPVAPRPPDGTLRLCFVGRLVPLKGCDDLLLGVAGANESSRISVTFVGWGPQEATLRQLANDLRVKASFLGSLDSRAVHAVLADSDVLVAPSRNTPNCREQWGRVVVEAMMSRRCVLVSDSGELPFLVGDPECVFPQNDPESLSKALDALTGDHPLVRKRAVAAYEQSQKFHPAVLAGQMLRVWSRSLDVWGTPRSR